MAIERTIKGRTFLGTREIFPRKEALEKQEEMNSQGFETQIIRVHEGYRVFYRRRY